VAERSEPRARVQRLLDAARRVASSDSAEGRDLRARLRETTGLSAAGIERALAHALETRATEAELKRLLETTPRSPRAHVLLSGNVFVAALRAIAIGLASSAEVVVRASRRDPALAEALHAHAPELFELTEALAPRSGDHVWAYGSDETLAKVRASLPSGARLHRHGTGFGAVALAAADFQQSDAHAIALDTALFDQRGCLSPRVVLVRGSEREARDIAAELARALKELEPELPLGERSVEEQAEARRSRDAAAYAFELFDGGTGWVSLGPRVVVPPTGRNLHVTCGDAAALLQPYAAHLTCVATSNSLLSRELTSALPGARIVAVGHMQRPPLDGPVDQRPSGEGELVQ
jgi:Acyl-CoA reductase (LuxC)